MRNIETEVSTTTQYSLFNIRYSIFNRLNSMLSTLEAAGMTMDDLVSVQVFCSDVAHCAAFNAVCRTYFTREFPARAFIGAGTLLFEARFEVQGIAVKRWAL